jgi:hypothetical protein
MPSLGYDLEFLGASLGLLESYLMSKELYWQLGGNPPRGEPAFPSLTLGAMLLAQARANERALSTGQEMRMQKANQQIEQIRRKWSVAWENKAGQEHSARLKLWRDYLEEYRQNPQENAARYPYEVSRRVMLQLLQDQGIRVRPEEEQMLSGLDRLVSAALIPGDFVWESELVGGFPKTEFAYLYGRLKN